MNLQDFFYFLLTDKLVFLNLISLILFSFVLCSLVKRRIARSSFSLIFALFTGFQITSIYFVREFIGYRFYVHFNTRDISSMAGNYIVQSILFFVILLLFIWLFFKSAKIVNSIFKFIAKILNLTTSNHSFYLSFKILLLTVAVGLMSFSDTGVIRTSTKLFSMLNTENRDFNLLLIEGNFKGYVKPKELKGEKGKNIVIISLESLEKGFINPKMAHLTPNLNQLKKKWSYLELNQNVGSSWTSGSLYTVLTGFPAFFGKDGNKIFQSAYHSNITGISHLLEKLEYEMTFLTPDASHSGTQELLSTFKIEKVIDKNVLRGTDRIHDKDLFEAAKQEIKKKKSRDPYMLFISTLDTHFPNGYYDKRMEKVISNQETELEFAVASADYLLGDFIHFLEQNNELENTTVYIFPDHLKMGDPTIFEGTGERGLYLLTNADSEKIKSDEKLYQIDLSKMILEGADIQHNITFLTDYIKGDKNEYIKEHINFLTSFNVAGLLRLGNNVPKEVKVSKLYKEYAKDANRFIAHAGGAIEGKTYTNSLEAMNLSYKKGFRLFELDIIETSDGKLVAAHDWRQWANKTENEYTGAVSHSLFMKSMIHKKFTPMDMEVINNWFTEHPDAILVTDKINNPKRFVKEFVDKKRLMMELFTVEALKQGLNTGMRSAMASQSVLEEIKYNIAKLKGWNVNHVAVSRRIIESHLDFVNGLRKEGIRTYAFHVNYDDGIDEEFVVKYEMDNFYGIYADNWAFEQPNDSTNIKVRTDSLIIP